MKNTNVNSTNVAGWNNRVTQPGAKVLRQKAPGVKGKKVHYGDVTRIYLSEIGRAKLLTADEEKELSRAARDGCEASRRRMIECNLRLVVRIARAYINRGLPL